MDSNKAVAGSASWLARLRHEPLLRFGLIGLGLFALNAWLAPTPSGGPGGGQGDIVIAQSRIDDWSRQYRASNGRPPSAAERDSTVAQWVDEELLYRQALELGLHQNDSIVRRQLVRKMEFVIEGATPLPAATDAELEAFMNKQPEVYSTPAKTSLQQVFFGRGRQGDRLQATAQEQLAALRSEPDSFAGRGDGFILGQQIHNADQTLLRKHFGLDFVTALQDIRPGSGWQGPIPSGLGLHLVRVLDRTAAQAPRLADVRRKVALDYRLRQEQRSRREALDALRAQYTVRIADDTAAELADAR